MRACSTMLLATILMAATNAAPITIFMIGDSTMADKPNPDRNPERGWGQLLPMFLDGEVTVVNHAVNGRSTKSFIDEGRWDAVVAALRPGDHVLIQFGHNDEKREDPARFADANTTYRRNLERFVSEARAKGARAILLTPIVRRKFNPSGALEDTHGAYPAVVREVANALRVPMIDLESMTAELISASGPERSKALYVWVAPGEFAMYPDGRQDDTHLSVRGASEVARLVAAALRATDLPLARHVRAAALPR
jgi:lysophospholipase L1-like esterase